MVKNAFGCGCENITDKIRIEQSKLQQVLSLNMDDPELCANKKLDYFTYVLKVLNEEWVRCNCEKGMYLNEICTILNINSSKFETKDISVDDVNNIYYTLIDNLWEQMA